MAVYKPSLPLDLTGNNPSNLITNELHVLYTAPRRIVIPKYGCFFKEGITLTDSVTNNPLLSSQYLTLELYQQASLKTGKEVYNVIIITDPLVVNPINITYQALGGAYSTNSSELLAWFNEHQQQTNVVDWADITGKPKKYKPDGHKQHSKDLFGAEYLIAQMQRTEKAIIDASNDNHNAFLSTVQDKISQLKTTANDQTTARILERYNSRFFWSGKASIGLSQLENYAPMSLETVQAVAKASFDPDSIIEEEYLTLNKLQAFSEILGTKLAQSGTTQIGVRSVIYKDPSKSSLFSSVNGEIFVFHSKQWAASKGLEYDVDMYPDELAADEEFSLVKISSSNTHYGGIWLGFAMDSFNTYVGFLINDMCHNRIVWNRILVKDELNELTSLIDKHIADNKNPHELTKKQIDLGKVENLPVVSTEDIMSDKGSYKYVTLDTLMYYTKKYLTNAKPPLAEGEKPDPNRRLMNEDAIIFTQCKPCTSENKFPSKGQLVRTWCDGSDRFARYTDGTGGFEDKVLQLDSDDCKYFDMPKAGTVLAVFCDSKTKMSTVADGKGGSHDVIVEVNSKDCGYVAPQVAGTVIAQFCQDANEMVRYADGDGNTYDMVLAVNSERCGYVKPPEKGTVLNTKCVDKNEVTVYADGLGGSYEEVTSMNSAKCGYTPPPPPSPAPNPTPNPTPSPWPNPNPTPTPSPNPNPGPTPNPPAPWPNPAPNTEAKSLSITTSCLPTGNSPLNISYSGGKLNITSSTISYTMSSCYGTINFLSNGSIVASLFYGGASGSPSETSASMTAEQYASITNVTITGCGNCY